MKGVSKSTGKGVRFVDRTNTRNGRLTFLKHVGFNQHKHSLWLGLCDCGGQKVTATPSKTMSCGCLLKEIMAKHGASRRLNDLEKEKRVKENAKKQRLKRLNVPEKAMQSRLSRLHRHALAQVGGIKKSSTFAALGYSVDEFVHHIEKQFLPGMGWHNMSEWQIDHIIPSSTAKTVDDVIALNQLANLRPLWTKFNNAKKNKVESLL
jgi:hypothetical protein